jgi:capsular exopolysaccharide synthesis family protein
MAQETPVLDQQAAQVREHQLRFVINVLTQRWRMIALFTMAACLGYGALGLVSLRRPHGDYHAQAKVVVTQSLWDRDALKGMGGTPLTPFDAPTLAKRTSLQRLSDRVVRALVQLDTAEGRELSALTTEQEYAAMSARIQNALTITPGDAQSGVITLEVTNWPNRDEAARIVDLAARVFVDENRQARVEEDEKTHDALKHRLSDLQQELYNAETAQWEFKKSMGFQTYGKAGDELTRIYDELAEKRAVKQETQSRLAELEAELKQNGAQLPEALGNVTDTVISQMLSELDKLLQEQLTMDVVYTPAYPGLKQIEDEIAEKKAAVLEAVKRIDEAVGDGTNVWKQRQTLYRQQLEMRLSLTGIDIRMAALQRMLDELMPKIPELANKNMEYERLEKDAGQIREQFNKLREKEFDIRTALSRESGQVERHESVIASAVPIRGASVRMWVNFIIGGLVGFVVGFGLAVMIEIMDTSIRSIEDVSNYIGLEVIGTIPKMRFGKPHGGRRRRGTYVAAADESQIDACIVTQHDPKSPVSEAYRTLRTNFQFATIKRKPRTVMVTSAVPGEGKTTTAVNMAVTMADRGMRVLLVDTDLRRPNVHRVLRVERGPGLADVLREGADLTTVMRETRVENLWIVSSGRVPPNPSELIASERMQRLIERLGGEFDLVICDAPSILVVTDPVLLATHVDSVVLVVSANNARRETVLRACKLLQTANASVAGVVLNGVEATRRHYYYYYYYYEDNDGRNQRRWYHL